MGVGGQCHTPATLPPGKTQYPLYRRLGGPQGWSGRVWKILHPPGFSPQTVQPIVSRYTNRAILAHCTLFFFGYWHQSCYSPCNELFCLHVFWCHKQVMRDAKDGITSLAVTDHEIVTGSVDCKVRRYDIRANRLFSDFIGGINALPMYVYSINLFVCSQHVSLSYIFPHKYL